MAPQSSVSTKSNPVLVELIHTLKQRAQEQDAPVWKDVAQRLEKPTRRQPAVNVSLLERHLAAKDMAVIPGKLLSSGSLTKPITVAALSFSEGARVKVTQAGGKCLSIAELAKQNPTGAKVRILG
jgi:large subunit ribosomal protein L18e